MVAAALTGTLVAALVAVPAGLAQAGPAPRLAGLAGSARVAALAGAGNLLTFGYGNARSDDDAASAPIATLSARPVFEAHLDGTVYGQPLIVGGSVLAASEHDTLYSLAAATGRVQWKVHLGVPVPRSVVDSAPTLFAACGFINPLGITSTPVVDPALGEVFTVEESETPGAPAWKHVRFLLVAVSLRTHRVLFRRNVDPPLPNTARSYYVTALQQRPALTLSGGRIVIAFGGLNGDCGQYHGYLVSAPEAATGALRSYEVPTAREGAIWETNGAVVSPSGDLYVATGNGSSSSPSHFDEGDAVVELSPALRRLGVWAPSDWVTLNATDGDLGSAGPVAVPGSSLLFEAGKASKGLSAGYLLQEGHLAGVGRGAVRGALCPSGGGVFGADAAAVIGSGAAARPVVFAPCSDGTEAVVVDTAHPAFHRLWHAPSGSPDGTPVVAGGLVLALNWNAGRLVAMQERSGHVVATRATEPLPHFATPAVGDGLVVLPTATGVEAFAAEPAR